METGGGRQQGYTDKTEWEGGTTVKAIIKYTKSYQGELRWNLAELVYVLSTQLGTADTDGP